MCLSRPKNNLRLVVVATALMGTLLGACASIESPQQCRTDKNPIEMSYKNVEAFRADYVKKLIAGELNVSQMVCDLGKPHVVKTAKGQSKIEDLSVQNGDRYVRWGATKTNDPVDEISISVVINADDMVQSYANHFPFKKELMSLTKLAARVAVSNGAYTREVTTMTVPATK